MGKEISNSSVVAMIEERLPKDIKAKWCLQVIDRNSTVDEAHKFPSLLEFLQRHQRAIEYANSDLRSSRKPQFKGTINHTVKEDSVKQGEQLASTPRKEDGLDYHLVLSKPQKERKEKDHTAGSIEAPLMTFWIVKNTPKGAQPREWIW